MVPQRQKMAAAITPSLSYISLKGKHKQYSPNLAWHSYVCSIHCNAQVANKKVLQSALILYSLKERGNQSYQDLTLKKWHWNQILGALENKKRKFSPIQF